MFEQQGIATSDRRIECINDAVRVVSFENSHIFAYNLYHKDKDAAKAVYEELKYWINNEQ